MDKPFKTISEQIEILESRGLSIGADASSILRREGYYPVINGYKDPFLEHKGGHDGQDRFLPGTTFDDIYRLFSFDRKLRMTLFSYFAKAEATLKTVSAYVFAESYQDDGGAYLKRENYSEESWCRKSAEELIEEFEKIIGYNEDGNLHTKRQYIQHYVVHHDCVPIWVLSNYLSLGQVFKFYCFQKESVRNKIAHEFSDLYGTSHRNQLRISQRRLRLAFDHIKDFRNICAHDERLYCARVSPSKDVNVLGVMSDLAIVLTSKETQSMVREVMEHMLELSHQLEEEYSQKVFDAMGISEFQALVSIASQ